LRYIILVPIEENNFLYCGVKKVVGVKEKIEIEF
jgi:hypothetical protein